MSIMEENQVDENIVISHDFHGYIPKVGMEFEYKNDAYEFYNYYGWIIRFSIRRDYANKYQKTGQVTSKKFTCCKEGFQVPNKCDDQVKNHHAESRTHKSLLSLRKVVENFKLQALWCSITILFTSHHTLTHDAIPT